MKEIIKISESLNKIDLAKKVCEAQIHEAIGKFMRETGVEPTFVEIEIVDASNVNSVAKEFAIVKVVLEYNCDARFDWQR